MLQLIGSPGKSIVADSLKMTQKAVIISLDDHFPEVDYVLESGLPIPSVLKTLDEVMSYLHRGQEIRDGMIIIYTNHSGPELIKAIIIEYSGYSNVIFMHK